MVHIESFEQGRYTSRSLLQTDYKVTETGDDAIAHEYSKILSSWLCVLWALRG